MNKEEPQIEKRINFIKELLNIKRVKLSNKNLLYKCEWCGAIKGVQMYESSESFNFFGRDIPANRKLALCKVCQKSYREYYQDYEGEYNMSFCM